LPSTIGADTIAYATLTNTGRDPAINAGIDLFIGTVDVNATPEVIHQKQNSYASQCKAQGAYADYSRADFPEWAVMRL
jgi:hypothetical protein